MSSMSDGESSEPGAIMVTSDLENWDYHYNTNQSNDEREIKRPFAVLFDPSNVDPKHLKQIGRGFGNEIYLNKNEASKLKIIGIFTIDKAFELEKKFDNVVPGSEEELKKIYDYAHSINEDYRFEYNKEHTPTDTMATTSKKAEEAVARNNLIAQYKAAGGVVTGEKRGKKIKSKTPMTHHEVRALRDLFTSLQSEVSQARAQGLNVTNSAVIQIWELNGGEAGKTWANGILGSHHDSSMQHKDLRRGYGNVGITKNLMKARLPKKQKAK